MGTRWGGIGLVLLALLAAGIWRGRAEDPAPIDLPGEAGPPAKRLAEADKCLAAKKWTEAVAILESLLETSGDELLRVDATLLVRCRWLCHSRLCKLPPEALARYRTRSTPRAKKWLEAGIAGREVSLVRRVVDEAFATRSGEQALHWLGDFAFERGRWGEAEFWYRRLARLDGRKEVDDPDDLTFPDPLEGGARARAKQLLVRLMGKPAWSLPEGWLESVKAFRTLHPKNSGNLAGQTGLYAEVLLKLGKEQISEVPGESPALTFAGDATRNHLVPGPKRPLDYLSKLCRAGPTFRFDLARRKKLKGPLPQPFQKLDEVEISRRLAFYPVVAGRHVLVADARFVTAYDTQTGKEEEWFDATQFEGGIKPKLNLPAVPDLRYSLTVAEGMVFARLGLQSVKDVRPAQGPKGPFARGENNESVLVCLGLKPGKGGERFKWLVQAIDIDQGKKDFSVFEGAPVVQDGRVYIAATRFEGSKMITAVRCYPSEPEDSKAFLVWRTDVCATNELAPAPGEGGGTPAGKRQRHHLITVGAGQVFYCSHSGAIVALDARTGKRNWSMAYPRRDTRTPEDEPELRDLLPCVYADGRLFVAPIDSEFTYCLDPSNGRILWERRNLEAVHLFGVGQGRLIFTTRKNPGVGQHDAGGLRAVGVDDGSDRKGWVLPDDGGGLTPMGRGLLVDDLVLWPTARKPFGVFAVRQKDGEQADNPALLHRVPSGNMAWGAGCLAIADMRTLLVYVQSKKADQEGEPLGENQTALEARPFWSTAMDRGFDAGPLHRQNLGAGKLPHKKKIGFPLKKSWEQPLSLGEILLPGDGKSADKKGGLFWTVLEPHSKSKKNPARLICRSIETGKSLWSAVAPFVPHFISEYTDLVVAAGAAGIFGLNRKDGSRAWTFPAMPEGQSPVSLTDFRLAGGRIFFLKNGRSLLAMSAQSGRLLWQRRAPGAAFIGKYPRGYFSPAFYAGEAAVVCKGSGKWLILDAETGHLKHQFSADLGPGEPTPLGNGLLALTGDRDRVVAIQEKSGKVQWEHRLSGKTTQTGARPLVLAAGNHALLIQPANIGYQLSSLDGRTGKEKWRRSRLLEALQGTPDLTNPTYWTVDDASVFHLSKNGICARSLEDGAIRWERERVSTKVKGVQAPFCLSRVDNSLLAWPQRTPGLRFQLCWLPGSVEWLWGPSKDLVEIPVDFRDPETGKVSQRLQFPTGPVFPAAQIQSRLGSWQPEFRLAQTAAALPGLQVEVVAGGLIVCLRDRVWGLFPDK
jgi:outer membrane protein assembly factor BamB